MNSKKLLSILLAFSILAAAANAKPTSIHKKPDHKKAAPAKSVPPGDTSDTQNNVWKPEPKFLAQLGPEQTFGPYAMRVPVGFTVKPQQLSSDKIVLVQYEIMGPSRKDGSTTAMGLITFNALPGYTTSSISVEKLFNDNGVLKNSVDLVKTSVEYGSVSGLDIARQYYKFRFDKDSPQVTHGFAYAVAQPMSAAKVYAIDKEPYNTDTLPLCEAAARTLRKTN